MAGAHQEPDRRRPDPIYGLLYDKLTDMSDTERRHASELGAAIAALGEKLDAHAEEDRKIAKGLADRLLIIEVERRQEQSATLRRGVWAGIAGAAGLNALVMAVRSWAGWK